MIVLIDQDGPLADFEGEFLRVWRNRFPRDFYVPLERRKHVNQHDDYPEYLHPKVGSVYLAPGFFLNLRPVAGAIEAVRTLAALGHEVFICTSPTVKYENCVLEKYQWVEQYLGKEFTKRVILSRDKTLVHGQILIDDNPDIVGVKKPEWEQVIFDYPYNRQITGKRRLTWQNWREVLNM